MIPLCLLCEYSAAFKFLSDGSENPGGVFFVFSNTEASCIFYQKSHFIHWLFSQPIVYSSPPFLFFRKLVLPRALDDSELCKGYDSFGSGHGQLYLPKANMGSKPSPVDCLPGIWNLESLSSSLVGA